MLKSKGRNASYLDTIMMLVNWVPHCYYQDQKGLLVLAIKEVFAIKEKYSFVLKGAKEEHESNPCDLWEPSPSSMYLINTTSYIQYLRGLSLSSNKLWVTQ